MKKKVTRAAACVLAGVVTVGTASYGVVANPTAGVSSYTSNILTSSTMPTAGVALAFTNVMTASAEENILAAVAVEENTTPEVAEGTEDTTEEATTETTSEYANIAICQVTDSLNVRSAASEDADIVGKLYSNNAATVLGEENGWYQIQSGNVVGYVKAEYVSVGDEAVIKAASRRVAHVTVETLRVRTSASTDSEILSLVPLDDELTVVDESIDGWVGVSVEEGTGYVSSEFVTLDTEYTYGETSEEIAAREAQEEKEREEAAAAAAAAAAKSSKKSSSTSSSTYSYSAPSGSNGSAVVNYACQFVGNPYVYGGSSLTSGTDCSGFVMSVYAAFGISLPHSSYSMRSVGYEVSVSDMQPGDIVCYSGHVAIYVGNNTIVHAANSSLGITYTSPANYNTIITVRRIF